MTAATKKKFSEFTKDEKIAHVKAQIAGLTQKLDDIINDVVRAVAKKAVVLPEVGAEVLFTRGRTTATTSPTETVGVVLAVKPAATTESGKALPAQIKVQVGTGFDAEFVVIYPAQIKHIVSAELTAAQ